MQELRLLGVSEDGTALLLAADDGGRWSLPITDELRSTIRRDRREPASAEGQAKTENSLRPRDVQGLIRGGVPLEEIAERAGWPLEKVQRYEGPIRAERDYVSELAQRVELHGRGETTTLRERADRRLAERGVEAERVTWDSWKNDEAHWSVVVRFPAGGRQREATWVFDPVNRALRTVDDEARWLGGDEIAAVDEEAPKRQKPGDRKRSGAPARPLRDADVYDVEAEGGLAEAQGPHLGAALAGKGDAGKPGDLTASMRARQASRGRGKSASGRGAARPTALPNVAPDATGVERVERLDLGATPPPAPSHPRPQDVVETSEQTQPGDHDTASHARRADAGVTKLPTAKVSGEQSEDVHTKPKPEAEAATTGRSSRRRKSRRSRATADSTTVRSALQTDDSDQDESLFGELPGFHDGGEEQWAPFERASGDVDHDAAAADATETPSEDARPETDIPESSAPTQEESLFDEDDTRVQAPASSDKPASKRGTTVPERASQARKSGRPSVPSWDDIMFGGRGPKK